MGDSNSGTENSDVVVRAVSSEGDDEDDHDHDQQEDLKRMISNHPLFGLLLESHINCLKVGLGEIEVVGMTSTAPDQYSSNYNVDATINPNSSDLDKFMEAYCTTLKILKEAMDKPFKETTSFIKDMYAQLKELSITNNADQPHVLPEN